MELLIFILERFYYSLASGLIINLFIMLNFYILDKKDFLPKYLRFIKDISLPENVMIVIFIIAVIMVGLFIEGVYESCFQHYKTLYDKKKLYVPKRRKPEVNRKTFLGFLLWHIFRRVGIVEACWSFKIKVEKNKDDKDKEVVKYKEHKENPLYEFMCDHKIGDPNVALLTCEKVIVSKNIKSEINMYRSFSFITQLARFSFLIISIISFLAMLVIAILWGIDKIFWCVDRWEAFKDLFLFYLIGFVISFLIVIISTQTSFDLGIRYARDVGRWYRAIKISGKKIIMPNEQGEYPKWQGANKCKEESK